MTARDNVEEFDKTAENTGFRLSEVERLILHNLVLRQQQLSLRLRVLTLEYLQTSEPRSIQVQLDDLTQQLSTVAEKAFAERDLDRQLYQLNIERGFFERRQTGEA